MRRRPRGGRWLAAPEISMPAFLYRSFAPSLVTGGATRLRSGYAVTEVGEVRGAEVVPHDLRELVRGVEAALG